MQTCDVLIVGAGPTGLVLALWLRKFGVDVRIIDKTDGPGTTSRALAVQARTLELYEQLDLARPVVEKGHKVPAINLWARGRRAARIAFKTVGEGLTRYAFLMVFPQDEHEKLLIDKLATLGASVARATELVSFTDKGDRVVARVRTAAREEEIEARYIAGCDGARSVVRESLKTGFPGGTYRQLFYVADVEASGPPVDGELHIALDQADFLAVFPLAAGTRVRFVGTVRDERAVEAGTLKFGDVSSRAMEHLKLDVAKVNWFSTYHVHHRVSAHFREGRAFLLGDAAHIHSPAGGQGMNTGIGDAINLAWKIATCLNGDAPDSLLDSYEAERIPFARRLVRTTDQVFTLATAEGAFADILRTRIAPVLLPALARVSAVREFLFRTVSQTMLNYRGSSLSRRGAGAVQGGERLPWLKTEDADNYSSLAAMRWQVHVYGTPNAQLARWCRDENLPLHEFRWRKEFNRSGIRANTGYLIRPDSYVAAIGEAKQFARYCADTGIKPRLAPVEG